MSLDDVRCATVAEARSLIQSRDVSAAAVAEDANRAISSATQLNAFITVVGDKAVVRGEQTDHRLLSGDKRALDGVVLSVKDNYCTAGIETTAGSRILRKFKPTYESFVTQRLLNAGATIIGKTNMDEFGMGSSSENSAYGVSLNPVAEALGLGPLSPGGSSSGAAVSVAANLCHAALGTDTGGSVRQPAALCGAVGFKPTYGVCSRWGIVAYASSLDQAGIITKSVNDAALLMDVISGTDINDCTSLQNLPEGFSAELARETNHFKIGVPRNLKDMINNDDLSDLWNVSEEKIRAAGGEITYIDIPSLEKALPTYYIIALCEASSNLARYDGVRYGVRVEGKTLDEMYSKTRGDLLNWETKRRILIGTHALSAGFYDKYFAKAHAVREVLRTEFSEAFQSVDFLMWPTTPRPAFPFGSHKDPTEMYLEDIFTVPVNLAELPAISLPLSTARNGLPMGTQIIGPRLSDKKVLSVASQIMGRTN